MQLQQQFEQYIKHENLFQKKDRLLLAVSGGVDSVVLCDLCKEAGYQFAIAHCNFKLRDNESEEDEKFVKSISENYEVEYFVKRFDTEQFAVENKLSIQVAARKLRYDWFAEIINNSKNPQLLHSYSPTSGELEGAFQTIKQSTIQPFNHLCTAHHADDNIETILMNLFKGTGIAGLKGILKKQNNIVRPLLFAKKEDILTYASEQKLQWREDSSNDSDKYTRNYFRNVLIPGLQKVFPQVKENLLGNIDRFGEINFIYTEAITKIKDKLILKQGNEFHIPVLKLLKTEPLNTIMYEIIKDYNFSAKQTDEAIKLLHSESGKYIVSPTHRLLYNRKFLIISPLQNEEAGYILIEENEKEIKFSGGTLNLKQIENKHSFSSNALIAELDAKSITYPLLLRKWKQGDYFYPLGMQKKKKLSRFFIDQKLSLSDKEKIWVLEMNKKIIWVLGMRIDDRFKINANTKKILQINLVPSYG